MTRREILRKAAELVGVPVPSHCLSYAMQRGFITRPESRPDLWLDYTQANVEELVAYIRQRGRRALLGR